MKKGILVVLVSFTVMLFGIITSSCASTMYRSSTYNQDLGSYNRYYAAEQSCLLEIPAVLKVDTFNGKSVQWGNYWLYGDIIFRSIHGKAYIRIPEGIHELTASYFYKSDSVRYNAEDLKITYNFLAGRTYRLDAILFTSRGEVVNDPTNYLAGTTSAAFSIRLAITESASTIPESKEPLGVVNNRRLDGSWQFSNDPSYTLVFFGDTWRLLRDDKIFRDSSGLPLSGIFFLLQDDEVHCIIIRDQGLPIKYKLAENTFTITSVQFFTWMEGQWNRIDHDMKFSNSNPLVGTWKATLNNGSVTVFQFDSTGTVRQYIYDGPGYLDRHSSYDYEYNDNTNSGIIRTDDGIIVYLGNNANDLIIENVTYMRE